MSQALIEAHDLHFTYDPGSDRALPALRGIDLEIQAGECVAIIGRNGSGKSTLARHLNALLLPTQGKVLVQGLDTRDRQLHQAIRHTVGMVFQNPDNQIVATVVEEDVAFGPENLGLPREELRARVDWALEVVGLSDLRLRSPHHLSAGQRQRLALAGVLAMRPACLVLDEATAMLDPAGRMAVQEIVRELHRQGLTTITITQRMEEAAAAKRVVVLSQGQVALDAPPRQVFADETALQKLGLGLPPATRLARFLHNYRPDIPPNLLTPAELVAVLSRSTAIGHTPPPEPFAERPSGPNLGLSSPAGATRRFFESLPPLPNRSFTEQTPPAPLIEVHGLHYSYMRGTPLETAALSGVDLAVRPGEVVGVIGPTGSGKSTLLQHLNGLLRPQAGTVRVSGLDLSDPHTDLKAVRLRLALLFQKPEDQLFEQYLADDVAFGPLNLGLPREEVRQRVRRAMEAAGLPLARYRDRLTFSLSGGERRRAALAGVLALEPQVLVLDEPLAGLDPQGRQDLLALIQDWQRREGRAIIWTSHSMEEIARLAQRIYVLAEGRVVLEGTPQQVFAQGDLLTSYGLEPPFVSRVLGQLASAGIPIRTDVLTLEEAAAALEALLR